MRGKKGSRERKKKKRNGKKREKKRKRKRKGGKKERGKRKKEREETEGERETERGSGERGNEIQEIGREGKRETKMIHNLKKSPSLHILENSCSLASSFFFSFLTFFTYYYCYYLGAADVGHIRGLPLAVLVGIGGRDVVLGAHHPSVPAGDRNLRNEREGDKGNVPFGRFVAGVKVPFALVDNKSVLRCRREKKGKRTGGKTKNE